ncbi:Werner Syndrome-like exonuclease isoform X4 [Sesamum indicum]|uniref:3'-5' exonuclease n=1 Tax=Sesamum indicum TaxID=4182 RepID=A0A8M8UVG2_SESIN|nr:Werner Syndrome-like exonuclease isoform X4 [Sesamum indicum]
MGSEIPNSDTGWDYPLTDEDLRAIDSAFAAAAASAPPSKRHALSYTDEENSSVHSPPKTRRRLPDSLFVFQQQQNNNRSSLSFSPCSRNRFNRSGNNSYMSPFRGVAPGKAAVLQICGENSCCYVLHIIHSQIPKSLQRLLEDQTSLKVGVAIANDAAKVSQDYNVSIKTLEDLSDLANRKLGGEPKKWSLSTLTEMLTCRQLPKPNKIRLGNWEVAVLSQEQLNYAATDAYVSWYLYQVLKNLPDPPENKSEEIVVPPNDLISSTGIW